MTRADLLAWMARLTLTRREAASALGVSPRTLERYLRPHEPRTVSRTMELLCGYVEHERMIHYPKDPGDDHSKGAQNA